MTQNVLTPDESRVRHTQSIIIFCRSHVKCDGGWSDRNPIHKFKLPQYISPEKTLFACQTCSRVGAHEDISENLMITCRKRLIMTMRIGLKGSRHNIKVSTKKWYDRHKTHFVGYVASALRKNCFTFKISLWCLTYALLKNKTVLKPIYCTDAVLL